MKYDLSPLFAEPKGSANRGERWADKRVCPYLTINHTYHDFTNFQYFKGNHRIKNKKNVKIYVIAIQQIT